jgi:hypothetical protein
MIQKAKHLIRLLPPPSLFHFAVALAITLCFMKVVDIVLEDQGQSASRQRMDYSLGSSD